MARKTLIIIALGILLTLPVGCSQADAKMTHPLHWISQVTRVDGHTVTQAGVLSVERQSQFGLTELVNARRQAVFFAKVGWTPAKADAQPGATPLVMQVDDNKPMPVGARTAEVEKGYVLVVPMDQNILQQVIQGEHLKITYAKRDGEKIVQNYTLRGSADAINEVLSSNV